MEYKKVKLFNLILIIVLPLIAVFFIPNNPSKVNISQKFLRLNKEYLLGTDNMGRCEFSRLLAAGQLTMGIVIIASIIIFLAGTFLGLILSNNDRRVIRLVSLSFLDSITAIPTMIYLVIIVGILGNNVFTMIFALTISIILRLTKFVMTLTEDEQKKAYCICAKCLGASNMRILFIHVLPNIIYRIISYISLSCAEMIMMISGFSFIGISLGDGKIDWGFMLNEGRNFFSLKPSLVVFPMMLIIFYSFIFNYLAKLIKEVYSNA